MQSRRLRPVAALTLALLAAPFLAASAVAQTDAPAGPVKKLTVVSWLSTTTDSVRLAVRLTTKATETVTRPDQAKPLPAVRAEGPPPPMAPPSVTDPSTWIWPADGPVTSPFGRRWGRMHEGVDIDAAYGSPVVAAHRGTVVQAGWGMRGYGRVVHIDHGDGLLTSYNHLASISATVGQVVEQGAVVGTVGASGSVTAAHLHYEVREHGVARNPATWLPAGGASTAGNPG